MTVLIRSIFDEHEHEQGYVSIHPTKTQQQFRDECDINIIMARYQDLSEPLIDPFQARTAGEPMFGDFSEIPNLQEAQNKLIEAETMFMRLPSSLRKRFDNDPIAFVTFVQDEKNIPEMRELGIMPKLFYREDGAEYYFRDGMPVYTGNMRNSEPTTPQPSAD